MKTLFIILFLIHTLPVFSQEDDRGKIEALKIAYLTKKLNLSPEEAQRFWPIYNNYAGEIRQARQEGKRNNNSELQTEEKILGIRKKYNSEFSRAINPEKINTFFRSEKDFGNFVQKELAERRQLRQHKLNNDRSRK
jgi:hypothetical protein